MREIRALTALRGLAAMAVVMQHFSATAQLHAARNIPSLVPHGYMAVDFFFTLSGFIMCFTYLGRFERSEPGAYRDFLARRVARIYPLNIAVVLMTLATGFLYTRYFGANPFFDDSRLGFDTLANLLLLEGIGIGQTFNGPAWSVSVELVAYLAFPLLIALVFHRIAAVRWLTLVACVFGVVFIFIESTAIAQDTIAYGPALIKCFAEFSFGMFIFSLYRSKALAFVGSDESVMLLLGAIALTLILRADLPASFLFPFLVLACARNNDIAARLLGSPVPYFLGVVSYSLYLIHNTLRTPALGLLRLLFPEPLETLPAMAFALLGSLAMIPFAWLAYTAVERPGRTLLRRFLERGASKKIPLT